MNALTPFNEPAPPAPATAGWYPLHRLDGAFQRFLLEDLVAYPSATTVIGNELYVRTDLIHRYTEYDVCWTV